MYATYTALTSSRGDQHSRSQSGQGTSTTEHALTQHGQELIIRPLTVGRQLSGAVSNGPPVDRTRRKGGRHPGRQAASSPRTESISSASRATGSSTSVRRARGPT
jgi:hypothetical protein